MSRGWKALILVTVLVASAALVLGPILYGQIQKSRRDICEQTNERHDEVLRVINRSIRQLPPRERARAIRQRNLTLQFVQALAPKRDCAKALN